MRENLIIYTQRPGASTPKDLKRELDCRRITHTASRGVRLVPDGSLIVNWGGSRSPDWVRGGVRVRYLNHPEQVRRKTSKVGQIRRFVEAGVPTLEVTTDRATAQQWSNEGSRVLARRDGSFGGRGITVIEGGQQLPDERGRGREGEVYDFYSRYFKKTHEYRYHVFQGRVIDVAQKKRSRASSPTGDRSLHQRVVRSWDNGWIFAHRDLHLPRAANRAMSAAAVAAVRALGLDFGAVDVLARFSEREPSRLLSLAVCEVNTAPGVECTQTLNAYVEAIQGVYDGRTNRSVDR